MATAGSVKQGDIVTKDAVTYYVLSVDAGSRLVSCEKRDGTTGRFRFAEADVTITGVVTVVDSPSGVKANYYNN